MLTAAALAGCEPEDEDRLVVRTDFCVEAMAVERNFDFRKRLLVVHEPRLTASAAPRTADETEVAAGWRIVAESEDPVVRHAAVDLEDYFRKNGLSVGRAAKDAAGAKRIRIGVDPSLKDLQAKLVVGEDEIRVAGVTPKEAFQGCCRLEDEMDARGRAAVLRGERTYTRLFSPRMTHSGYEVETFPDAYLDRLAHAGMDAILVFIEDPPDVTRNGKIDMNALVDRAAARGIDAWAYASFPEKAAKFHPLDPGAEDWYAATYGAIVKNCPRLKGLICVGESCGFPSRDPGMGGYWWQKGRTKAMKLNGFWPVSDWPDWINLVKKVTRQHSPDFEIVFWTYNWFKKPADIRLPLLEKIPTDITLLVTWVRGDKPVQKCGVPWFVTDYSITVPGPSAVFRSETDIAVRRGIPVMTISNTGGRTWDSGVAPYVPTPGRWKARFDSLKAGRRTWGIKALMESHHYGFMPSFISDLAKVAFTAETDEAVYERAFRVIVAREFGEAAAPDAMKAFAKWDDAFEWHSVGDSDFWGPLRDGPSYPLMLPGEKLPPPPRPASGCADAFAHETGWKYVISKFSRPKEVLDGEIEMCERELALLKEGADILGRALDKVPAAKRDGARRIYGVGAFFLRSVENLLNVKKFYRAGIAGDKAAMLRILADERRNVEATIPLVEFDSSLGWEPTMGYVCDRTCLEWKLLQLTETERKLK